MNGKLSKFYEKLRKRPVQKESIIATEPDQNATKEMIPTYHNANAPYIAKQQLDATVSAPSPAPAPPAPVEPQPPAPVSPETAKTFAQGFNNAFGLGKEEKKLKKDLFHMYRRSYSINTGMHRMGMGMGMNRGGHRAHAPGTAKPPAGPPLRHTPQPSKPSTRSPLPQGKVGVNKAEKYFASLKKADISNPSNYKTPNIFTQEELFNAARQDMMAELDAINLYEAHKAASADPEFHEVLDHLITEEKEHVELLQGYLKRHSQWEASKKDVKKKEVEYFQKLRKAKIFDFKSKKMIADLPSSTKPIARTSVVEGSTILPSDAADYPSKVKRAQQVFGFNYGLPGQEDLGARLRDSTQHWQAKTHRDIAQGLQERAKSPGRDQGLAIREMAEADEHLHLAAEKERNKPVKGPKLVKKTEKYFVSLKKAKIFDLKSKKLLADTSAPTAPVIEPPKPASDLINSIKTVSAAVKPPTQVAKPKAEPPKLQDEGKKIGNFSIGQTVHHQQHGIGQIVGHDEREFSPGKKSSFFIVNIQDNGANKKVFVPTETAHNKLKPIMPKAEGEKLHAYLKSPSQNQAIDHQTWNRRYRDYMDKIHSGDPYQLADTVKSLMKLMKDKELSFGERKLLDQARTNLNDLLTASTGRGLEDEEEGKEDLFTKAERHFDKLRKNSKKKVKKVKKTESYFQTLKKAKIFDFRSKQLLADTGSPKVETAKKQIPTPLPDEAGQVAFKSKSPQQPIVPSKPSKVAPVTPASEQLQKHPVFALKTRDGYLVGKNLESKGQSPHPTDIQNWLNERNIANERVHPRDVPRKDLITDIMHESHDPHTLYEVHDSGTMTPIQARIEKHPNSPDYNKDNWVPPKGQANRNYAFTRIHDLRTSRYGTPDGNMWIAQATMGAQHGGQTFYSAAANRDDARHQAYAKANAGAADHDVKPATFLMDTQNSPKGDPNRRSSMLMVGTNNYQRSKLPFFVTQQSNVHYIFHPQSDQHYHVGAIMQSRTKPEGGYVEHTAPSMDEALQGLNGKIVTAHHRMQNGEQVMHPIPPQKVQWLENHTYRQPKISFRDILHLEPYGKKKA